MQTTYLKDLEKFAEHGIAYIPIGTLEWHGRQLPIETDLIVGQRLCELVAKEVPGYVLPPFFMAGYSKDIIDDIEMRGMDRKVGKKLPGNIYFLKPELLVPTLKELIKNLKDQGFHKIVIISGHGGGGQTAAMEAVIEGDPDSLFIDPYQPVEIHHADKGETSILWACMPEEEVKGKAIEVPADDDLTKYREGVNQLDGASLELGKEMLDKMVSYCVGKVKDFSI